MPLPQISRLPAASDPHLHTPKQRRTLTKLIKATARSFAAFRETPLRNLETGDSGDVET
jgi:hypothetical protein